MPGKIVKVLVITGLLIVLNGCAASRKNLNNEYSNESKSRLLMKVKDNNIGKESFTIQKISVNYDLNGEKRKLTGNLKHNNNGDILLSIRIPGGIEVARIYLDKDSVRINDRLNKIYRYGKADKIIGKFGLNYEDVYLLFGDLPEIFCESDIGLCENGISESRDRYFSSYSIRTKINCNEKKVVEFSVLKKLDNSEYNIVFDKINSGENYKLAEKIYFEYKKIALSAEIELKGFKLVNVTNMRFKPGSGYKYQLLK